MSAKILCFFASFQMKPILGVMSLERERENGEELMLCKKTKQWQECICLLYFCVFCHISLFTIKVQIFNIRKHAHETWLYTNFPLWRDSVFFWASKNVLIIKKRQSSLSSRERGFKQGRSEVKEKKLRTLGWTCTYCYI